MKAPLRFIIHAGERKTGSTAIQRCLTDSYKELEAAGILYSCGEDISHDILSHYYQNIPSVVHTDSQVKSLLEKIKQKAAAPSVKYLLISAESLLAGETLRESQLELPRLLQDLLPENRSLGSVDLIIYIREPVSHFLSVLNQASKWKAELPDFNDYRKNLYHTLEALSTEISPAHMHVKTFQKSTLFEGCVVKDFFQTLEAITGENVLSASSNMTKAHTINFNDYVGLEHVNASLFAEQFIALHHYRKTHFAAKENEYLAETTHLLRVLYAANQLGCVAGSKVKLSQPVINIIRENNQKEVSLLEKSWNLKIDLADTDKIENLNHPELDPSDLSSLITEYDPQLVSFYQSLSYRNNPTLKKKVDWDITKSPYVLNQSQFKECWARLLYLDFCYVASFQLLLSIIPSNITQMRVWKPLYKTFVKLCLKFLLSREK